MINLLCNSLSTLTETVLETTCHGLDVTSTTSTSGTTTLDLKVLVKVTNTCSWVCTGCTGGRLGMVRVEATTWAHGVGLLVTLTEGGGTTGLLFKDIENLHEITFLRRFVLGGRGLFCCVLLI